MISVSPLRRRATGAPLKIGAKRTPTLSASLAPPASLAAPAIPNLRAKLPIQVFSALLILAILNGCTIDFKRSSEQIEATLKDRTVRYKTIHFQDYAIDALSVGPADSQPVLFIHGSPGTWDNYLEVIPHLSEPLMIFYDRPGFGKTTPAVSLPDLKAQSEAALAVLDQFSSQKALVVGHSYGGPIALQIALDYPERTAAVLLLAASVDPELEELRWYNHLTSALAFIIPGELVRSNDEMIPLKEQLVHQRRSLQEKQSFPPVYVMHGTDDSLVPVENVNYVYDQISPKANLRCLKVIESEDHFIPWTNPELLSDFIRQALQGRCSVSPADRRPR